MRRKILVMQASLEPPGGGNGVAAWMIEALRADYCVTLLTWKAPDLDALNRFFGTSIRAVDLEVVEAVLPRLVQIVPLPLGLLRDFLLMRACRRMAGQFDVVLTAMNESDLGCPGIQYIHYPRFDPTRPAVDLRWYHSWPFALALYHAVATRLTGFSFAQMRANATLVNSEWTGRRSQRLHAFVTRTLYPPVAGAFPDVPWHEREDRFVCIGRISPEKRIDEIVAILAEVRRRGHPLPLHIIGANDDESYTAGIRALAREHADWVHLHERIGRDELIRIVTSSRYGIHAMRDEHFGMAVAEMIRGGCIAFVPNGGGQVEIIGPVPELLFENGSDAVVKIVRVLTDAALQQSLRERLRARAALFSADLFKKQICDVVNDFNRP